VSKRLEERGKWWELRKENKIKEMSHGKGSHRHMSNNQFVLLIIQSMHLPKHAYF